MTNIEPYVLVRDVAKLSNVKYGQAGKIALVGAFPNSSVSVGLYTNLDAAKEALKGDYKLPNDTSVENASKTVVPSDYTSFYCLDYIFESNEMSKGPESVLVVNVNKGKSTLVSSVNNTDLANALSLLTDEDFDILTIADNVKLATTNSGNAILNPIWATLKSFYNTMYANQKPFGIITGVELDTNATVSLLGSFKTLFKDKGFYKAVVTPIKLNGEADACSIAQSGCWHSAFTSGRPVNKSETNKLYPNIIGEDTKTLYPSTATGIKWSDLLNNGLHTTKYRNRRLLNIQCLSNITPADYDMKIERVKNYMIKRLNFTDVLGEDNNTITKSYIEGLFEYEKNVAISNNFLTGMEYNVISIDQDKVRCNLLLQIPDIVRVVELNVTLEIPTNEEA